MFWKGCRVFGALCTCCQALTLTWWLPAACRQSCSEKMISLEIGAHKLSLQERKVHQNYPGEFSRCGCLGVTSLVVLTHVSLPSTAWCPDPREWSTNSHWFRITQVFMKYGDHEAPVQISWSESWAVGPVTPPEFKKVLADCGKS